MNIFERSNWLAEDFREGLSLNLSEIGRLSMATILRVHFRQVAKSAKRSNNQKLLDKLEKLKDEVWKEYNRSVKDYTAGVANGLSRAIELIHTDQ